MQRRAALGGGKGRVEVAQCSEVHKIWETRGLILWRPLPPAGWFTLGDWAEEIEGRAGESATCSGFIPIVREEAQPTASQESEDGGSTQFFGVGLEALAKREGRSVPAVIEGCVGYLEKVLNTVGLFRIDVTSLANSLTRDIDAGVPVDFNSVANPHAAAGLVKRFLRRLPEPLFPFSAWDALSHAIDDASQTPEESMEKIKDVIQELPQLNVLVMRRIFRLLAQVAQRSAVNLMPASNLASMLGPNVLYPPPAQQDPTQPELVLRDVNTANAVVETIITSIDFFFPPPPPEHHDPPQTEDNPDTTLTSLPVGDAASEESADLKRRPSQVDILKSFFEEKVPQRHITERPRDGRRAYTVAAAGEAAGTRSAKDYSSLVTKALGSPGTAASTPGDQRSAQQSTPPESVTGPSDGSSSAASPPSDLPLLAPAKSFVKVWDNAGLGSRYGFVAMWKAVPPSGQYVALGHIVTTNPESLPPSPNGFRCVHVSAVKRLVNRRCVWKSAGDSTRPLPLKKLNYRNHRQVPPCSIWIALPEEGSGTEVTERTGMMMSFTTLDARNEPLYALRRDCNFVALCKDASLFASPKREFEWEDGDETLSCHLCGAAFTIIRRRHRCRACEQVFCGACSVVADKKKAMSRFKIELLCLNCKKQKQAEEKESQESLDLLRKWREEQRKERMLASDVTMSPRTGDAPQASARDRYFTLIGNTREKKEAFEPSAPAGASGPDGGKGWKTALSRIASRSDQSLLVRGLTTSGPVPTAGTTVVAASAEAAKPWRET